MWPTAAEVSGSLSETSQIEGTVLPVLWRLWMAHGLHVFQQDLLPSSLPMGGFPFIFENIASPFTFSFCLIVLKIGYYHIAQTNLELTTQNRQALKCKETLLPASQVLKSLLSKSKLLALPGGKPEWVYHAPVTHSALEGPTEGLDSSFQLSHLPSVQVPSQKPQQCGWGHAQLQVAPSKVQSHARVGSDAGLWQPAHLQHPAVSHLHTL